MEMVTWEDKVSLKQRFPRALAWGQAASKRGGIVSSSEQRTKAPSNDVQALGRPKRQPRLPARLAGPEWAHVGVGT